ncbi:unnamed protein product, partial (macronuclear) [Paramecium tetraurelia]
FHLLMVLHQHLFVEITLSVYGMLRQDNRKPNQMVIKMEFYQSISLLMVLHQHLVVMISLSVYGMLRQDNKKPNQMVIQMELYQSISLLMVLHQHLVVMITLSVYGMLRQDNKKPNQMVIQMELYQSISLLMVLHQHLVVEITLSVYGMLRQDNKKPNQMVIKNGILSVNFSPDGTTLASGSYDKSIRLWDVKTGQQILPLDNRYQIFITQFSHQILNNNLLPESVNSPVNYPYHIKIATILIIRCSNFERRIYQSIRH